MTSHHVCIDALAVSDSVLSVAPALWDLLAIESELYSARLGYSLNFRRFGAGIPATVEPDPSEKYWDSALTAQSNYYVKLKATEAVVHLIIEDEVFKLLETRLGIRRGAALTFMPGAFASHRMRFVLDKVSLCKGHSGKPELRISLMGPALRADGVLRQGGPGYYSFTSFAQIFEDLERHIPGALTVAPSLSY